MRKNKSLTTAKSAGRRTNIRASKVNRLLQSASAKTNSDDIAKLLFRSDSNSGRNEEVRKLAILREGVPNELAASYSTEQLQYMLFLTLIVSIAEQRTEELYRKDFAARCDAISTQYGLKDDEYWNDAKVPAEWEQLNKEFEQSSSRILVETLIEYHQDDIAQVVQTGGRDQLFEIINSTKAHFNQVLKASGLVLQTKTSGRSASIPETLQSFGRLKRA